MCGWGGLHLPDGVTYSGDALLTRGHPSPKSCPEEGFQGPALHSRPFLSHGQQRSQVCAGQAGLAAILCVLIHPHVTGLVLRDRLLTHHGHLALPGVTPEVSKIEKKCQNLPAFCLHQQGK